jgi:hypothetical protein
MPYDLDQVPKVLAVYLKLSEYPILAPKIRERMRQELFDRGIITAEQFEQEVEAKAVSTQEKEGLDDPFYQESPEQWTERLDLVRDHLTDFYFALNLPHTMFEDIVRSVLSVRRPGEEIILTFNPELAPWHMLFAQAEEYEKLSPEERVRVQHHLRQIIVVIIRGMISDQLDFVGVAREHFEIADLRTIYERRIGRGKIGGKAAGMTLAFKVLQQESPDDPLPLGQHVAIPDSYYIGADVYYDFKAHNELYRFSDQKYKSLEEIESDYPEIFECFLAGSFPPEVVRELGKLVEEVDDNPLIVRSSSLLEDNFGKSFAGKYDSFFCPNQGSPGENLEALLDAIRRVYASTLNPDALFYRQQVGLVDYDERMAVLIQRVKGSRYGRYYFPAVAGVAFGRNPFRWNRKIRRQDGLMRIVWGLGTRAVDRVANDYPRMVALSHPQLRPEVTAAEIKKYSQHFVDLIDLERNSFETLPVSAVIGGDYPSIEMLASADEGEYVRPLQFRSPDLAPEKLVLTFDRLVKDSSFTTLMKTILHRLEGAYGRPVDIEFVVELAQDGSSPRYIIHLLQCRPLSSQEISETQRIPQYVPAEDVVFSSTKLVPDGVVSQIEYIVYVDPGAYAAAPDYTIKHEVGRVVGRLNKKLEGQRYILVGPGRWGTSNVDLGVKVSYADIYNSSMLVEVAFGGPDGLTPEVSYGTHFFQDLVESNIYPLPLYPGEEGTVFNHAFFQNAPNRLTDFSPDDVPCAGFVKLIDVRRASGGRTLEVVMSADEEQAIAYLRADPDPEG